MLFRSLRHFLNDDKVKYIITEPRLAFTCAISTLKPTQTFPSSASHSGLARASMQCICYFLLCNAHDIKNGIHRPGISSRAKLTVSRRPPIRMPEELATESIRDKMICLPYASFGPSSRLLYSIVLSLRVQLFR